jgi:hypothetical protein
MRKRIAVVLGTILMLNITLIPEIHSATNNYAVWWGDSLTAGAGGNGISATSELEKLQKIQIQNRGVGGENSTQIAVRSGAKEVYLKFWGKGKKEGDWRVYNVEPDVQLLRQGMSVIAGNIDKCVTLLKFVEGKYFARIFKCSKDFTDKVKKFSLTGLDNINAKAKFHLIWSGRNNAYDSQTVVNDIAAMITNFRRVNPKIKVYVLSVINGASEGIGTGAYNNITKLNESFIDLDAKFVDVRRCLIDEGLRINNLKPKSQDEADIASDLVPTQLRSDGIHLNPFGYHAVAVCVNEKINQG